MINNKLLNTMRNVTTAARKVLRSVLGSFSVLRSGKGDWHVVKINVTHQIILTNHSHLKHKKLCHKIVDIFQKTDL